MKNAKNDSGFDLLILKSSVPDSISLIIFICFAMREVNEITGKNVSRFVEILIGNTSVFTKQFFRCHIHR